MEEVFEPFGKYHAGEVGLVEDVPVDASQCGGPAHPRVGTVTQITTTMPVTSGGVVSPYGGYVTRVHTTTDGSVTNYTAPAPDIREPTPYGTLHYPTLQWPGAYGWVVDNDGYGNKNYLATYLHAWHGLGQEIPVTAADARAWIDRGYMVIAGGRYSLPPQASGHYAVIVGYSGDNFIVNDPYGYHQLGGNDGYQVTYSWNEINPTIFIAT